MKDQLKSLSCKLKEKLIMLSIDSRKTIGNILSALGKYELALNVYFKALCAGPLRADIYFSMGKTLYSMGNGRDASKFFEKSLQYEKDNPIYLHWLIQANTIKEKPNYVRIIL